MQIDKWAELLEERLAKHGRLVVNRMELLMIRNLLAGSKDTVVSAWKEGQPAGLTFKAQQVEVVL